jgi:hypothetical protein
MAQSVFPFPTVGSPAARLVLVVLPLSPLLLDIGNSDTAPALPLSL